MYICTVIFEVNTVVKVLYHGLDVHTWICIYMYGSTVEYGM